MRATRIVVVAGVPASRRQRGGRGHAESLGAAARLLGHRHLRPRAARRHLKRHGLTLDILYTEGGAESQQAVIGGSMDIAVGVGVGSVLSAFTKARRCA